MQLELNESVVMRISGLISHLKFKQQDEAYSNITQQPNPVNLIYIYLKKIPISDNKLYYLIENEPEMGKGDTV